MKRSLLNRGKALRRGRWHRDPTPTEGREEWGYPYWGWCPLCLTFGWIVGHHIVPRRTLRRRDLLHLMWDIRNRLLCGEDCCHTPHENRSRPLLLSHLPTSVFEFAAEHNLGDVIDRYYKEAA